MQYRKDIQILRGWAVLLVVLYHLQVEGFTSGFLGVDIFFVISGYLMAVMYTPERKLEFFSKRARRLLPAYFVVVLATLATCLTITTPNDFGQVARQALFATAFLPNIGYWLENSYFDKAAFKPLLHLWSLGVEIQFYLLIPVLFWVFKRIRGSFALLALGSLAACWLILGLSPKTAFFWMPLRLWEFFLGYGVVMHLKNRSANSMPSTALSVGGMFMLVCIPILDVDGTAPSILFGHPGMYAAGIAIATAAILYAGMPKVVESLPIAPVLEKLGLYSYSIYLAHFPVIVLFLYQPFEGTVLKSKGFGQTAVLVAIVCVASFLLYQFIEAPFRSAQRAHKFAAAAALAVLVVCPAGIALQRVMFSEKEMLIFQAWSDRTEYRCGKINRILHPLALTCEITAPLKNPAHRVLLVGDSHADSIKSTFASVAQSQNVAVRFMVENNPLSDGGTSPRRLIEEAQKNGVGSIVLHYAPAGILPATIAELAALTQAAGLTLGFILPVPGWKEHVPKALWKKLKQQHPLPSQSAADYLSANNALIKQFSRVELRNLKIYPTAHNLCQPICKMSDEFGRPLYFDSGHLTLTGSEQLRQDLERVIFDMDGTRSR